jgi:hypothetical protein
MATVKNLVIDQGTTYSLTITVSDATGEAVNLTGYTLRSQLRKSYGATSYTAFTAASASPTTGELTISLTDTQTSALKSGRYVYDVEIVDTNNAVTRVLEGIITVTPEVTR